MKLIRCSIVGNCLHKQVPILKKHYKRKKWNEKLRHSSVAVLCIIFCAVGQVGRVLTWNKPDLQLNFIQYSCKLHSACKAVANERASRNFAPTTFLQTKLIHVHQGHVLSDIFSLCGGGRMVSN